MKLVSVTTAVGSIANCLCYARVEAPVSSLLRKVHPIKASEDHDWNKCEIPDACVAPAKPSSADTMTKHRVLQDALLLVRCATAAGLSAVQNGDSRGSSGMISSLKLGRPAALVGKTQSTIVRRDGERYDKPGTTTLRNRQKSK
jgi:Tfp pilus assembly protein FimT